MTEDSDMLLNFCMRLALSRKIHVIRIVIKRLIIGTSILMISISQVRLSAISLSNSRAVPAAAPAFSKSFTFSNF